MARLLQLKLSLKRQEIEKLFLSEQFVKVDPSKQWLSSFNCSSRRAMTFYEQTHLSSFEQIAFVVIVVAAVVVAVAAVVAAVVVAVECYYSNSSKTICLTHIKETPTLVQELKSSLPCDS